MKAIVAMIVVSFFPIILGYLSLSSVCMAWKERRSCTEMCNAVYIKKLIFKEQNHVRAYGVFEYSYQGKKYAERTRETLMLKEEKRLKEGETYQIYINPSRPQYVRFMRKGVYLSEILILCMGAFLMSGGIIVFIIEIVELIKRMT